MTKKTYTDKEITDFVELAQEVGITRAKRELGYPNSWNTGKRWADMRGVEIAVDDLKAQAAAVREWYKEEEVKALVQEGFNRVYDELVNNRSLSADDMKKLSDAANKYYQMWANIQGKASTITENRSTDSLDAHLQELLFSEQAKNDEKKKEEKGDNKPPMTLHMS